MRPSIHFLAAGIVIAAQTAVAQEAAETQVEPATQPLTMPAPATTTSTSVSPSQTPGRGLTMAQVRDKFGSPSNEVAAVGTPPISRWEYPGYTVFFEGDLVLHTVVAR